MKVPKFNEEKFRKDMEECVNEIITHCCNNINHIDENIIQTIIGSIDINSYIDKLPLLNNII